LFAAKTALYLATKYAIYRYSFYQKTMLQGRLMKAYLNLPYTLYLKRNSADVINLITTETTSFSAGCLLPLLDIVANLISVTLIVILLARTDLLFLSLMLIVFLPFLSAVFLIGKLQGGWGKSMTIDQRNIIQSVNHALGGLKEIKVNSCEDYFQEKLQFYARRHSYAKTLSSFFGIVPRSLIELVLIVVLVSYVLISYLFLGQNIDELTSVLGVFAAAAIRLVPSSSQISQAFSMIQSRNYSVNLIYNDLREVEMPVKYEEPNYKINPFSGVNTDNLDWQTITVSNLSYRYPGTPSNVLEDINLEIKKGESLAFIGKSGAGKTTLVDVFLGLLVIKSGDIRIGSSSIYENFEAWKRKLAYIPQSIFLLDDSIQRNVAFGVPDNLVDRDRLLNAVKAAQLDEFVSKLPDGLDTSVGERGVLLSGGQRQRIGIARALYQDREILVLDEATSALDTNTENLISEAINSLAGLKTLIIVAHRYSTVKDCDVIYKLEGGQIVKSGSYEEVIAIEG
jgi:ABC-type multidrug transport system fused ATPase/permease subunit